MSQGGIIKRGLARYVGGHLILTRAGKRLLSELIVEVGEPGRWLNVWASSASTVKLVHDGEWRVK